jgi:hypothetical protein
MKCPLCDAPSASVADCSSPDWDILNCAQCGEVRLTTTAYVEIGGLSAAQRRFLAEYCRTQYRPGEVINHLKLLEITG